MMIKPISILVVDDEEFTRKLFLDMLWQYSVTTAKSTSQALAIIKKNPPDIVVTDINMPGEDGFVLLSRIKQDFPNIVVIIITGHGQKSILVGSMAMGAFDYLEKPVERDEFLDTIDRAEKYYLLLNGYCKILLVEDDQATAMQIESVLKTFQFGVCKVANNKELALKYIEQCVPR